MLEIKAGPEGNGYLADHAAVACLAGAGLSITRYEKSPTLCERDSTQLHAEFTLNRSIHALYSGGAGETFLRGNCLFRPPTH